MLKTNKYADFVIKSDATTEDEQCVWAVVYQPDVPDSDNEFMDAPSIKKMAYDFLKAKKTDQIDTQHQNELVKGASVIESFIARKGDQDFPEGSWVVGMHIPDSDMWAKIKKGDINGYSIEAFVTKSPMTLEMDIPPVVNGITTKSADHEHNFFVTFDNDGKFLGGRTSIEKGHFHNIRAGTVTESEQDHNHRFSFVENAYTNPIQLAAIIKSAADCGVYPHKVEEAPPEVQVIASVEKLVKVETEVVKADFPLAKEKGADTSNDKEEEAEDLDDEVVKLTKPKKFKLAVKEAVDEVLKSMGFSQELVHKDWAKWNEEKKGGFANSGHQKMIDHHEAKSSEHGDKYTETDGDEAKAHHDAMGAHGYAADQHRKALDKLKLAPFVGVNSGLSAEDGPKIHQKNYDAAKAKADSATEKAKSASEKAHSMHSED